MTTCEDLAALLDYPGPRLRPALERCLGVFNGEAVEHLQDFASAVRELAPGEIEELYTRTFDLRPESCLYIGHQLFGEDWRRGIFMARLKHRYTEAGFSAETETPDYMPTVLRFMAAEPDGPENRELLQECVAPAAARVLRTLEANSNPYAALVRALLLVIASETSGFDAAELLCRPFSSSPFPILP